jgi:cell division protein FtsZ
MFEPMELTNDAVIKVIGVGGGGGTPSKHMVREREGGVLNSSR